MIITLVTLLSVTGNAQGSTEAIDNALKSGDASSISRFFGNSIDITINNSTSTYSRTQGEMVLRDFFNKNAARDFDIEHSGNSTANQAIFIIGSLTTNNGRYKVYMWMRPKEGGYQLKEIRFEK